MINCALALKAVNFRAINSDEPAETNCWATQKSEGEKTCTCVLPPAGSHYCRRLFVSCSCLFLSEVFNQFPPVHTYVCLCCADDRLVSILRHHNFLKELQEIAVKGESQIKHGCCFVWGASFYVYVMVHLISLLLSVVFLERHTYCCCRTVILNYKSEMKTVSGASCWWRFSLGRHRVHDWNVLLFCWIIILTVSSLAIFCQNYFVRFRKPKIFGQV